MSQEELITILNISIPLICGAFLAIVGLANKYPTMFKYAFRSWSTWVYLLLSAGGSLLLTLLIEAIGLKVTGNGLLNDVVLGLIGPGIFLGVLPNFTLNGFSGKGPEKEIKTLRDYVYGIIDNFTLMKTTQIVELVIRDTGEDIDPDLFLREVDYILEGVAKLSDVEKQRLALQFDKNAMLRNYSPIIRELIKYYEVDYIIQRFQSLNNRNTTRGSLYKLVQVVLESQGLRTSILPEFVIAKVQALQKNPEGSLYYLEQAIKKMPSLRKYVIGNESEWWILTSMTEGERHLEKIETLMKLMEIELPSIEDLKKHCFRQNEYRTAFMAIKKDNGDCVKVLIKKVRTPDNDLPKWWVVGDGDKHLDKECTNFDEVMRHIEEVTIPTLLIKHSS